MSALLALSTIYLFTKVSFSPDVVLSGGSPDVVLSGGSPDVVLSGGSPDVILCG